MAASSGEASGTPLPQAIHRFLIGAGITIGMAGAAAGNREHHGVRLGDATVAIAARRVRFADTHGGRGRHRARAAGGFRGPYTGLAQRIARLFPGALGDAGVAVFDAVVEIERGDRAQRLVVKIFLAQLLFHVLLELVESV
jgi:hypothetical protein